MATQTAGLCFPQKIFFKKKKTLLKNNLPPSETASVCRRK